MPATCPYVEDAHVCGDDVTWVVKYLDDRYPSCERHARAFMDEFWEAVPYRATSTQFNLFYLVHGEELWQVPIRDGVADFDAEWRTEVPEEHEQYEALKWRPGVPYRSE